jgi:hypothetical protein
MIFFLLTDRSTKQKEYTKIDYFLHVAFALVLCFYSFLILFSSWLLGFFFFLSGLACLGVTVWRGIKGLHSLSLVSISLFLMFISRIYWLKAFTILPHYFYEIFQLVFLIEFSLGIVLLYSLVVKRVPFPNRLMNHMIHISYFATAVLLIPYSWLFSYGAIKSGDVKNLFWILLIFILWGVVYVMQLKTYDNKIGSIAFYLLNSCIGSWALFRWFSIFG